MSGAVTEDKALLGSNLSAVDGPKLAGRALPLALQSSLPDLFHFWNASGFLSLLPVFGLR
jgi:hypothetical protein